ncbi:nucleoside deaminase [Streptomyces clavuligerus]|nr:nucleoside deaminase [Streptomyces clavuligerus]ANW21646.1 tRNA-specific adenosine deaminase [Streptomyces clavuligerus]AXU16274.1 nucleoside deaminase [Streptomyces clavuligerus]EDY52159.1 guanine deaminase [Streptomyces clavuligerus]MBY6306432.1 nucleoside deaminase [Streptomyces clavuligerus]QCS09053.1 nucleoside deaminase [Streptomyces clavuligerus]
MAKRKKFMAEAARLATESVVNGWGGPFGAVITKNDEIVARGQNRVLLTGDPTAHGEVEAIRKAIQVLNPWAPSIPETHQNTSTLKLIRAEPSDLLPKRARMLKGCEIYTSGAPCPMCMSAIYWSRCDAVYFSCDLNATAKIGFSDEYQYEDFKKPLHERSIRIEHCYPELGAAAYRAWSDKPNHHPY